MENLSKGYVRAPFIEPPDNHFNEAQPYITGDFFADLGSPQHDQ